MALEKRQLNDYPQPLKLKSKVFEYGKTFTLPQHPSDQLHPLFVLMALTPSEQIDEVRFGITVDPFNREEYRRDPQDGTKATISLKKETYDLHYGFEFPIPVMDVTVSLVNGRGKEVVLASTDKHVKSVRFENGILVGQAGYCVKVSYRVDISTFRAFDRSSIDLLQNTSIPICKYGVLEKELRNYRIRELQTIHRDTLTIVSIIETVNDGEFRHLPIKVNLLEFCAEPTSTNK